MPVRLIKPYQGQNANTLYWGTDEPVLLATQVADTSIEQASDYALSTRIVTTATANTSRTATVYKMNSATAQALTLGNSGYWPFGTVLTIEQVGAGATTVSGAPGVTINLGQGLTALVTKGQRAVGQLIKETDGSWTAIGGFN